VFHFVCDVGGEIEHGLAVAGRRGGVFRRVVRARAIPGLFARGGMNVDWTLWLALAMAAGLIIYLAVALLKPELFS
jgi:K+-transporting ATPase KdpF subunit